MEQNKPEEKRLFFALQTSAPWPEKLPVGRLLQAEERHCTLAFLGQTLVKKLMDVIDASFPTPSFHVGLSGYFDHCLFLPERHPHVAAWHVNWLAQEASVISYQRQLIQWLIAQGFHPRNDHKEFLSHVTLCRAPFDPHQWKKSFVQLPIIVNHITLYESLGNLRYHPCWQYPLIAPFEEIDHTADIAFHIRGESFQTLHQHARIALAFRFPPLLTYFSTLETHNNLDDIIIDLNELICKADRDLGCPFKAVSFHDLVVEEKNHVLRWEMIVDV